mmetsp:Transcript_22817/g.39054  ORF Transcript_22817/g.39054 Transcript_22817/m.39054 type:complete len:229 (-) Transcript_22817:121-807(-)
MSTFPARLRVKTRPHVFVVLFLLITLDQSDCQSCSELTGMSSFGNGFLCAGHLLELHIGIPISCRFIVNPSNISIFGKILFQFVDVSPARLVRQTAAFDNSVPDKRAFGTFFFSLRLRGSFRLVSRSRGSTLEGCCHTLEVAELVFGVVCADQDEASPLSTMILVLTNLEPLDPTTFLFFVVHWVPDRQQFLQKISIPAADLIALLVPSEHLAEKIATLAVALKLSVG